MKNNFTLLATLFLLLFSLVSCTSQEDTVLPVFPVQLRLGGYLSPDGTVGDYVITLSEGWIILGDLTIYGMDREEAGYLFYNPKVLKHAGHIHGEADSETSAFETYIIDLINEPQTVSTNMVTEGHYFDGKIRIRPTTNDYNPIWPTTGEPVLETNNIWGNSFILKGTALKDVNEYLFEITISMESLITGLIYGGTVKDGGTESITTLLNLDSILMQIDFQTLSMEDGKIIIDENHNIETLLQIKTELKNPENFFHLEAETIPDAPY
jgi:hypothetical protein